jgi:hypothetical protein
MSTFSDLKAKILAIAQANAKVNVAYDYDVPRIDQTPAVLVVPSGNESSYATVKHDRRMYAFLVTILVPYDAEGAEGAEDTLVEVVDSLLDDLDNDYTLTGSCLMMTAAPSAWGYQEREKIYRVATINLKCMTYFQVTS